jgi:hypothetical protein
MRRSVDGGPPVNYFAFSRTSGPVTLHVFPFASVPLKLDCAVWAAADTLHHRVRMVVTGRLPATPSLGQSATIRLSRS